jgi:DNA-binding response OmpR family regulator
MPHILVVDDQKDVRTMMAMVLRVNHFEVTEAGSGAAGLDAFAAEAFDAVIVDVFLSDANGLDVIAAMRERRPDLPVVAVSGMTSFDVASQSDGFSGVQCLRKPFRPNDLLRAIELARRSVGRPGDAERAVV